MNSELPVSIDLVVMLLALGMADGAGIRTSGGKKKMNVVGILINSFDKEVFKQNVHSCRICLFWFLREGG